MSDGGGIPEVVEPCTEDDPGSNDSYLYDCSFDRGIVTSATIVAHSSLRLDSTLVLAAVDHVGPWGRE